MNRHKRLSGRDLSENVTLMEFFIDVDENLDLDIDSFNRSLKSQGAALYVNKSTIALSSLASPGLIDTQAA